MLCAFAYDSKHTHAPHERTHIANHPAKFNMATISCTHTFISGPSPVLIEAHQSRKQVNTHTQKTTAMRWDIKMILPTR